MRKIAVYPGTFDPITLGHLDVIEASSIIFDKVFVTILVNPKKKPMFSEEERMAMIKESLQENGLTNVETASFHGLTVKFVSQVKAITIIRGLRLTTEYEVELNISFNNRILNNNIFTIFIAPLQEHVHISASVVRELLLFGEKNLGEYVPKAVLKRISSR